MSNPVIEAPEAGPAVTWQEGELLARRASSVRKAKRLALLAAGWVAMLLVWNVAAYYLPPGVLPSPLEVLTVMWEIVVSGAFVDELLGERQQDVRSASSWRSSSARRSATSWVATPTGGRSSTTA